MAGMVHGKVALVTGAGSGIGRKSAELLAQEGARVLVCDLDEESGQQTLRCIRDAGGEADYRQIDVAQESEVEAMVAHCVERFGRLDCAVNNAGISGPSGGLETIELPDWNRVLAVNLTGVFLCMKYQIPRMREQGAGSIVNMSSEAGLTCYPHTTLYGVSKRAVNHLTQGMAAEWAASGIQANAIGPGYMLTDMNEALVANKDFDNWVKSRTPAGRWGQPEELVGTAIFLASSASDYVNGQIIYVDGGMLSVL